VISVKHQLLAAFSLCLCVCVHTWMQHYSLQFVPAPESCEMPLIPPALMATAGTGWLRAGAQHHTGWQPWVVAAVLHWFRLRIFMQ